MTLPNNSISAHAHAPASLSATRLTFSEIAIRRHIGTLMLTLAIVVVGVFFLFRLQVDLLPAITYPRIGVNVTAPGVSPEVVLEEITKPLEEALSATEGVTQIYSTTRDGSARLDLYFPPGSNLDRALTDATATFNRNQDRLPDLVTESRLFKFAPSQLPIYEFALESESLEDGKLRVFADEELSRELNVIPGVAAVDISGGVTEEIKLEVDLERLQALGIGFDNVIDTLTQSDRDVAGGRLQEVLGEPLIRTLGRFNSVEEIANLSLDVGENNRVYMRNVATLTDGDAEQRVFVTLNGQPAVKVSIEKQPDANTVTVIQELENRLTQLRESGLIPDDMQLLVTKDESQFIINSITNVAIAGITGTLLSAIAVFLFLGSLRQTFIIVTAIPLATLAAIICMKLFGLSINIFSLGGLALGVGIVVDNSIVMLENISQRIDEIDDDDRDVSTRHLHKEIGDGNNQQYSQKANILQQSIRASEEVESALIASTATNLVAVLPFLLVGGLFSLLFRELILTISFAIAASLLLAVTVVPMLTSRLLAIPQSSKVNKLPFLIWFEKGFRGLTNIYRRILQKIVSYRIFVLILVFLGLAGSSYGMYQQLSQEILPRINTGQAFMFASFPPGTNLATNKRIMEAVDEIILNQQETEYTFTTKGGFIFGNTTIENLLRSSSNITLKPNTDLESFITKIQTEFQQLNLVDTTLRVFPQRVRGLTLSNSPVGGEIDLVLQGTDISLLESTGEKIQKILEEKAILASFRPNTDPRQPEIQIIPDREKLADVGLTVEDLGITVQRAIAGAIPTQLQREQRLIDIRVQLDPDSRQSIAALERLPLLTSDNGAIQLRDVANLTFGEAPGEIQRINQRSVYIMEGSLNEDANLSDAIAELKTILADIDLPEGVVVLPSYAEASSKELQSALKILGGLAVFLVFVVMAVQYNSLIDPLVILLTVPLALAGGILGLYVTQTAVGATVLVGAVLLVGIVVNNAIVMLEKANQIYHEQNCSRKNAIITAATSRLRPILMTTITTVLGMFPLALGVGQGSEFLQPLGVVVFSGLALATLLTLFIIPCVYVLVYGLVKVKSGNG
ncbi:Cation/multidrug efflux pump [Hyella patelloides LEGE 07179]|uniref:Cation/multidrug efflux pump n=1 Tax=Hyella patelloides LEGE 07179 TaxID=945734 RepID=A0A563VIT9_9CYAN|nr:efflux RND transporter permease subunit [Hyella patelloides]VEP11358.1 Cation/multidrug efflux pump [Hyella patelloides LEGE 07179]